MTASHAVQSTTCSLDSKQLLRTLIAVQKGDFNVRMLVEQTGIAGKIADTLNSIIELRWTLHMSGEKDEAE